MIGAEPDRLTLKEMLLLAGKWIAMEVYDEDTAPARRIAAVGGTAIECIQQIAAKGLNPEKFEYRSMKRPI